MNPDKFDDQDNISDGLTDESNQLETQDPLGVSLLETGIIAPEDLSAVIAGSGLEQKGIEGSSEGDSDEDGEGEEGDDESAVETNFSDDPLAPPFELDLEAEEDEEDFRRPPRRAKIENAKEFFSQEILYRFDVLEQDERNQLAGTYCLELNGPNGGVWTLKLGDQLDVTNEPESAEVTLSMHHSDFLHIVNGELNPQIALLAKKIKFSGDTRRAIAIQSMLAPDNN